ncbi:hypothetical protein EAF00_004387 [Botryotinia globosa]|nr:hypothetical protein EAF00_004387 [Botryotinia globosa]
MAARTPGHGIWLLVTFHLGGTPVEDGSSNASMTSGLFLAEWERLLARLANKIEDFKSGTDNRHLGRAGKGRSGDPRDS